MKKNKPLVVQSQLHDDGIALSIHKKSFAIRFPEEIWRQTPPSLKGVLQDNLVFGNTHWLPLLFDTDKIHYDTYFPMLESFLFRNQLGDLLFSESVDKVPLLTYFRSFYNLEFQFKDTQSRWLNPEEAFEAPDHDTAILPFTFGKESLLTLCLCQELGIKPILVYSQEPIQPYEEEVKRKLLGKINRELGVTTYFVENEPGLFREDKAFSKKPGTELGWGTQTTLLALLMLPFVYAHRANYILIGSEFSNNEYEWEQDWKLYASFDQTSFWTAQQNNMIRLLSHDRTQLRSSLEVIEEIQIFFMLHHRYPKLGQYQFSCFANRPLIADSQWCHQCYKCARMYIFATALGIDPKTLGFKQNLLKQPKMFEHYFGDVIATGSNHELDFAFYLAYRKKVNSPYIKEFATKRLPHLKPFKWYADFFTEVKPSRNLPKAYQSALISIFEEEMKAMKKVL